MKHLAIPLCLCIAWLSLTHANAEKAAASPTQPERYHNSGILGTVNDCTPDYSEERFRSFEHRMAQMVAQKARGETNLDEYAVYMAIRGLINPHGVLSNVTVTLRSLSEGPEPNEIARKTLTDTNGIFRFSSLPEGEYEVTARVHRGLLRRTREIQRKVILEGHRYGYPNINYYPRLAAVAGRVTDTSGHPLRSVRVTATHSSYNEERQETIRDHSVSTVTAGDGSYILRGLLPGDAFRSTEEYEIRAEADGFVTTETKIIVMPQEVRTARARLWRILMQGNSPDDAHRIDEWMAALPPCRGHTTIGVDLVLGVSATLSGRVTDPQEQPQPQCQVSLFPLKDTPTPRVKNALLPKTVSTDSQGAFVFHNVPAGYYGFRVYNGQRGVTLDVPHATIGESQVTTGLDLKLDLQPFGQIEATVQAAETMQPIANVTVSVWHVRNPKECWSARGECTRNAARPGTFSIANLSPGDAEIEVIAPGRVTEHLHVEVPPGRTAALHVRMERACTAAIRVIRDGAPLQPSEYLQAFSAETGSVTYGRNTAREDGWHEMTGLKAGHYTIRAHVFDGNRCVRYETAPVSLNPGTTNQVTIDFSGSSTLAIALTLPSGLMAQVCVEPNDAPAGQPMEKNLDLRGYVWADRSGDYEVRHLRPGTYRVSAKLVAAAKNKAANVQPPAVQNQTVILGDAKTSTLGFHFEHPQEPTEP